MRLRKSSLKEEEIKVFGSIKNYSIIWVNFYHYAYLIIDLREIK